jgi:tol-pal system protein YbgF
LAPAPAGAAERGPGEALAAEGTAPAEAGPTAQPAPIGEYGVRPLMPPAEVATAAVLPAGTPEEQYDHARSLLIQRDYDAAEKALAAFIAAHPDDELIENARYWLGETHYVRSDFTNAAVVFAEGFQKFPNGSKAPDSLLKLGLSLANLGETEQACKVFGELAKKFPDAPLNVRVRASRETQNLGCE